MYLCGASFGPLVTGRLSDLLARAAAGAGPRAAGLHQAMLVVPAFAVALAAVLWAGSAPWPSALTPRARVILLPWNIPNSPGGNCFRQVATPWQWLPTPQPPGSLEGCRAPDSGYGWAPDPHSHLTPTFSFSWWP